MRSLERNKQKIYYALYVSKTDVVDENGNYTGGQELTYGDIYDKMINVSPAKGTTEVEQFGLNSDYSKTLVTCDMRLSQVVKPFVSWSSELVHEQIVDIRSRQKCRLKSQVVAGHGSIQDSL